MAVGRMTLGAKCAGFKKEPNLTRSLFEATASYVQAPAADRDGHNALSVASQSEQLREWQRATRWSRQRT